LLEDSLIPQEHKVQIQAAFTAPKRLHKRAVVRNLLKRRLREVYRKHFRQAFNGQATNNQLIILFVYNSREILSYEVLETHLKELLHQLSLLRCSDPSVGS
jgi:ribonuclease P protein component